MLPVRTLALIAVVSLAGLARSSAAETQTSERTPIAPEPEVRMRELRAMLDRIRREMARLDEEAGECMEELRRLEQSTGVKDEAVKHPVTPHERAQPWIDDVLQIDDAEKRTRAMDAIRGALGGTGGQDAAHAALVALSGIAQARYDKNSFRELVLPWTEHTDPAVRARAFYALHNTAREPSDLARVLAQVDDPSGPFSDSIVHLLFLYSDGDLTGPAGDAVLAVLASSRSHDLRRRLPGLWGARVSPALSEKLLELSRSANHETSQAAVYFGLSTLEAKSEAVVDRLLELLPDPGENGGRALWGLGHGVPAELQPSVASAMLRLAAARSTPHVLQSALRLVGMYGTTEHVPDLERIASSELASEASRTQARESVQQIDARERR